VLSRTTFNATPSNMFLDGSSALFATQANKMYSVNVKAQGFDINESLIGQDLFAIFTTDSSNVVTRQHINRYGNHESPDAAFVTGDINVVAGTGTINVQVTGNAGITTYWLAYMWGVEMIKPEPLL
jgi:hypothetical protein